MHNLVGPSMFLVYQTNMLSNEIELLKTSMHVDAVQDSPQSCSKAYLALRAVRDSICQRAGLD